MGKGLHKVFKAVVKKSNNSFTTHNQAQECHTSLQNLGTLKKSPDYQQMSKKARWKATLKEIKM